MQVNTHTQICVYMFIYVCVSVYVGKKRFSTYLKVFVFYEGVN